MELFSQRRNVVKNIFFDGKPVDTMEMLRRYCDSVKKVSSENKKISIKKNDQNSYLCYKNRTRTITGKVVFEDRAIGEAF